MGCLVRRLALALAAVLLAGCAAGSADRSGAAGEPTGSAVAGRLPSPDPTGLVGRWQVEQAAGEEGGAVLLIGTGGLSLWRRCGMLHGAWKASNEGLFVGLFHGGSPSCLDSDRSDPDWIGQVAGYRLDRGEPVLLDRNRRPVARLRPGGQPTVPPGVARTQAADPVVTAELRRALRPAAPMPARLRTVPAAALVGRWTPAGAGDAGVPRAPYLELLGDGRFIGWDGCNGQGGRWTGGAGGALLAVTAPQTLVACSGAPVGLWLATAARAGMAGDLLVLLDSDGAEIARLQRAGPAPTAPTRAATGSATAAGPPPPPIVLARARQTAGGQNRIDAPVEWVQTTLAAFWREGGYRSDGDPAQQVYVIQLHGRFCCHPGPPGHDPTSTSVFDVLPVHGRLTDSLGGGGSTNHPLDLSRLGTVHIFTLP